jgi:hypothetical protein
VSFTQAQSIALQSAGVLQMNEPLTASALTSGAKPRVPAQPPKALKPEEYQQLFEDKSLSFPPIVHKALQVHGEIEQAIDEWKEAVEQASNVLNMKLRSIGVRLD